MGKQLKSHPASWKFKVVLESFTTNNVAETARKYGILLMDNRNDRWRRIILAAQVMNWSDDCSVCGKTQV